MDELGRGYQSKQAANRHIRNFHRSKDPLLLVSLTPWLIILQDDVMICYRWQEGPLYYDEATTWVAFAVAERLEEKGHEPWLDRKSLETHSTELKEEVENEMRKRKMIIFIIGMNDFMRCQNKDDFLRWELDIARELENDKKKKVIIIVYGVLNLERLFKKIKSWGTWGEDLKNYLKTHYVIFLKVDTLDKEVDRLAKVLDPGIPNRKKLHQKPVHERLARIRNSTLEHLRVPVLF